MSADRKLPNGPVNGVPDGPVDPGGHPIRDEQMHVAGTAGLPGAGEMAQRPSRTGPATPMQACSTARPWSATNAATISSRPAYWRLG